VDGQPAKILILVVSPKKTSGPPIQFLSAVGSLLTDQARRERLMAARTEAEVRAFFSERA
jgi:mannitol/fructose-specific phosphotransferase system IIA component (Ntr-type)